MSKIELKSITKRFGKITALNNVSLEIHDKEFFVLFGPAGAGKTTILNNIAGIYTPDVGEVLFDGEVMNTVEPQDRNVAMVFENYALYPQFTVYENIASPLRSKKYRESAEVIDKKVHEAAKILEIENLLDRLPSQLSNGQKQRVSLGRALVRSPRVFLMDEPIAHLDAKLRNHMRTELKAMQHNFDATTIYVTHDYTEALSLGDRIAIVNLGEIIQVGTGEEIFSLPANEFVAKLLGEPEINMVEGDIREVDGRLKVFPFGRNTGFDIETFSEEKIKASGVKKVHLGFRGYDITPAFNQESEDLFEATVYNLEPIGNRAVLQAQIDENIFRINVPNEFKADLDQTVYLRLNMAEAMFFNAETEEFITRNGEERIRKEIEESR